jgi:hypothetical protein
MSFCFSNMFISLRVGYCHSSDSTTCKFLSTHNYKGCSKKDGTFVIKILFYNISNTVPFRVVLFTGDTPFPKFLPLLECFLERSFCDGAQFSCRIFLYPRVLKKRPNFLNSASTSREGALRLLSSSSGRFWQQTAICPVSLWALFVEIHPLPLGALSSRGAPFCACWRAF